MSDGRFCYAEGELTQTYTASSLPAGYAVGMVRREGARTFVLFLAKGSIAANNIFKTNTAATNPYDVIATAAAATDPVVGANSVAGAVTNGTYFWGQVGGAAGVSLDGTTAIAAGDFIAASGTAGVGAKAPTSTAVRCQFGIALEALASGTAVKQVRLQGLYA